MRFFFTLIALVGLLACSDNNVSETASRTIEYGPWELRQEVNLQGPIEDAFISRREVWLKLGEQVLATCVETGEANRAPSGKPRGGAPSSFRTSGDCGFFTTDENGFYVHAPEQWDPPTNSK